jgi:hypothetical protein
VPREALLDYDDMQEICARAINANLAVNREQLFIGMSAQITSAVRETKGDQAAQLRLEVDRLNHYVDPGTDGYFLAVWLRNCANAVAPARAAAAKFFTAWATKVNEIPPNPVDPAADAGKVVNRVERVAKGNVEVDLALVQLRAEIGKLRERTTRLVVSKRLHDSLHHIQISVLPLWRQGIDNLSPTPNVWRGVVQGCQRDLRREAQGMAGELLILGDGDALRAIADSTIRQLNDVAAKADQALAAIDLETLKKTFSEAREIVGNDMQAYARKIEIAQEGLDLGLLVQNLTQIAEFVEGDDQLRSSARKSASALAAIIQNLDVIGTQHSQWQNLDVQLWLLETLFAVSSGGPGAFLSFNYQWDRIVSALNELAGDPPAEWVADVTHARDDFLAACPVPISASPSADAAIKFDNLVQQIRVVFQRVDQSMKDSCNLLNAITVELVRI